MKRILLILLIGASLFLPTYAQIVPFGELWNNISYYDTNLEKKGFASLLGRFEGKIGLNLFNLPLQVYGVYYGVGSQATDYWDNNVFSGGGIRFRPLVGVESTGWHDEWMPDLKVFAESLSSAYLKNAASAEAAGLRTRDVRYGLDLWHEWNLDKADEAIPWAELWANLSSRQTNFGWEDFNDYIFYFQPKIGRHLGRGIEIYCRGDLVTSGKQGASYYFLNMLDYGVGIRFEPWREDSSATDLFRKFKMFAEVLSVSYLKDKPVDLNKQVSQDVRFGIDFSYGR